MVPPGNSYIPHANPALGMIHPRSIRMWESRGHIVPPAGIQIVYSQLGSWAVFMRGLYTTLAVATGRCSTSRCRSTLSNILVATERKRPSRPSALNTTPNLHGSEADTEGSPNGSCFSD